MTHKKIRSCPADRASRVARLALSIPLEVMVDHGGMTAADLLVWTIAFNTSRRIVTVEAFAGGGKTSMLVDVVRRLPNSGAVLLLSYTKSAVRVAHSRLQREGVRIQSQTFDSLFYHSVNQCLGRDAVPEGAAFNEYRVLSQELTCEVLSPFECKARARYRLQDIALVLVDEAQDTPPEALHLLRRLRDMGKQVVVVGDRWQAIFSFMGSMSLFDLLHNDEKTTLYLKASRRCCHAITSWVSQRFGIDMRSAMPADGPGPSEIRSVVVQARCNKTLARLYCHFLFIQAVQCIVDVAEGESSERFHQALLEDVRAKYSLATDEEAETVVRHRQTVISAKADRSCRFIFSTTHTFKGNEADVTILGEDLAVSVPSDSREEEMVKYVACTRARWGIIDLDRLQVHAHPAVGPLLYDLLGRIRDDEGINTLSAVVQSPSSVLCMVSSAALRPLLDSVRACVDRVPAVTRAIHPSSSAILNLLFGWSMAARAWAFGCACDMYCPEYRLYVFHDRVYRHAVTDGVVDAPTHNKLQVKLGAMKWRSLVSRAMVTRGLWGVTQDHAIMGAVCTHLLHGFFASRNVVRLAWPAHTDLQCIRRDVRRVLSPPLVSRRDDHGILALPHRWRALLVRQVLGPHHVRVRSSLDLVVVDVDGRMHLVTSRFHPKPRTRQLLYAVCGALHLMGHPDPDQQPLSSTTFYNGMTDTCHVIPTPSPITHVMVYDLDRASSLKSTSMYHSRDRSHDDIVQAAADVKEDDFF